MDYPKMRRHRHPRYRFARPPAIRSTAARRHAPGQGRTTRQGDRGASERSREMVTPPAPSVALGQPPPAAVTRLQRIPPTIPSALDSRTSAYTFMSYQAALRHSVAFGLCTRRKSAGDSNRRTMPITFRVCKSSTTGKAIRSFSTNNSNARSRVSSGVSGWMSLASGRRPRPRAFKLGSLRREVDFLQVDHAQKPAVPIDNGQDRKLTIAQAVDHEGQGIVGVQGDNRLPGERNLLTTGLGQDCSDVAALVGRRIRGLPPAMRRWIVCRKE